MCPSDQAAEPVKSATGAADRTARRGLIFVVYLLCFLSGVAALVYEVAWARMLALTFGSATLSVAAVVAGFMGGMGIGARLYHHIYDRVARPPVIYACLEVGIAVSAALLSLSFYALPDLFARLAIAVGPVPWLGAIRFVSVFLLLLVPAMLMGATFPALCTVIIRTTGAVDRHLGMIYGINTIGAAVGVLLAGLVLIERLGLHASTVVANVINVAVAVGAIALVSTSLGPARRMAGETGIPTRLPRWLTGVVLFGSGFCTLAYEILWFRSLHYFVGNTVYAVSIMLVIFLTGLGFGSLLLQPVAKRRSPERDLALCQLAIAALALGAMACQWFILSQPALEEHISVFSQRFRFRPWWWRLFVSAGVGTLIMLPATLFMGLSFPLASRLFLGDVRKLGARVGGAYLLANLGGILGSVLAAVVILPVFGTIGGTKLTSLLNAGLAILLLVWLRRRALLPWAVTAAVVALALMLPLPASHTLRGEPISSEHRGRVIFVEEGDLATVQVLQDPNDPAKRAMAVDGFKIGWSEAYQGTQTHRKEILLAHLPMVLDPTIRRTLNVGLASATTLLTVGAYPEIETLDCVEISAAVVRANRLFAASRVLRDPRAELIVDDAVHYLLRTGERYDLIISDGKLHPFYSGNAALLCREFYEYALDRLTDRGVFVQWVPLSMLHGDFRITLRTVCEVFPQVEVFFFPKWAVLMVASRRSVFGPPLMTPTRYRGLPAHDDLRPYGIDHPMSLLAHWVAGREQLQQVVGEGPLSTWDHMRLDFSSYKAPKRAWADAKRDNLALLLEAQDAPRSGPAVDFGSPASAYARSVPLVRRAFAAYYGGRKSEALMLAHQAVTVNPDDQTARLAAAFFRREDSGGGE